MVCGLWSEVVLNGESFFKAQGTRCRVNVSEISILQGDRFFILPWIAKGYYFQQAKPSKVEGCIRAGALLNQPVGGLHSQGWSF